MMIVDTLLIWGEPVHGFGAVRKDGTKQLAVDGGVGVADQV
ncbi:hypothetical protein ACWGH8_01145 [Nonomuraea muscovyensis]